MVACEANGGVFMRVLQKKYCMISVAAVVILAVCISAGMGETTGSVEDPNGQPVPRTPDPNELRWDLARAFEFTWDSVELSAKLPNPEGVCILTISVKPNIFYIPRSDVLVTIDTNDPGICEVLNQNGDPVPWEPRRGVQARCYQERGWYWDARGGELTRELEHFQVKVRLPTGPEYPVPSSISLLQGYIYAVYADRVADVDIPFDRDGPWLEPEATPDLMLRVDPTTPPLPAPLVYENISPTGDRMGPRRPKTPIALYKYQTWVKSKTGKPVMGLRDTWSCCSRSFCPLGEYAVVRTELFDSNRRTSVNFSTQWVQSSVCGLGEGARCWGQVEQESFDAYDTIRHIIAVYPVEVKIPFVLTNIPVPGLLASGK
jgi:hypothetical protein